MLGRYALLPLFGRLLSSSPSTASHRLMTSSSPALSRFAAAVSAATTVPTSPACGAPSTSRRTMMSQSAGAGTTGLGGSSKGPDGSGGAADFLSDPSLLRDKAYVNGKWVNAQGTEASYAVGDPATQVIIARVPAMGVEDCRLAIDAAEAAFEGWKKRTAKERGDILRKWYDLILANQDDLAEILTLENGKPLTESKGEIMYAASFMEWYAEEAKRVYGEIIPSPMPGRRLVTIKQPVGVCALVTPWNFPAAMITRKPAEDTPLTALALCELAQRAGVPPGVVNVLTCPREFAASIGAEMANSPKVRKLSFTGSTKVGKILMRDAASTVKKISLELGGNAPFLVFDDADVEVAVTGTICGKFRNTGQTCVSPNRLLVQSGIYDKYVALLTQKVGELQVGHGLQPGVQLGPLINQAGLDKVSRHVQDAIKKGAQVVLGGQPHSLGGCFYEPTILGNCTKDMLVYQEETFGPVCAIFKFEKEEEGVAMANDTPFGLAAYMFTQDLSRAWRVSEAIEAGMVSINEGILSTAVAPFGGVKESGLGREGARVGIEEYLETKYICMGGIK